LRRKLPLGSWHIDETARGYVRCLRIDRPIYASNTAYQKIEIFRNEIFGKVLLLDDDIQLSEIDEWVYHEALVHPALLTHPEPEKVAVIGGGDGGALREVLKHQCVVEAYLVDIDREVVEACRRHLPEVHRNSFDDPRVRTFYIDGEKFLEEPPSELQVVVLDLTEPSKGLSTALYSTHFFKLLERSLGEDGVAVFQIGSALFFQKQEYSFPLFCRSISSIFPIVRPYLVGIPSFGSVWSFLIASKCHDPLEVPKAIIASRMGERGVTTRYYAPSLHKALFALPKFLAELSETGSEGTLHSE